MGQSLISAGTSPGIRWSGRGPRGEEINSPGGTVGTHGQHPSNPGWRSVRLIRHGRRAQRRLAQRLTVGLLSILGTLALAAPASARKHHASSRFGTLQIVVSGVGGGRSEHITVTGPRGFHRVITGATSKVTYRKVRPGAYSVNAAPTPARGGVDYAEPARVLTRVRAGGRAVVQVHYGNVVAKAVRQSTPAPAQVVGDPNDPSAIVLPALSNVKVGQIIWYDPSPQLPLGMFDKVTAVKASGGNLLVSLTGASIGEAFPNLNLNESIPIAPGTVNNAPSNAGPLARVSDEGPSFSFSFPSGILGECGSSLSSPPSISFPLSASASLDASAHVSGGTLQDASVIFRFTGSAGVNLFVPDGTGCEKDFEGVELAHFWLWIGYVPVPVTIEAAPHVGVSLNGDLKINASATLNAHAGVIYQNGHASQDSGYSITGSASGSFGGGKFELGPKLEVLLGLPHMLDANVDVGLYDFVKGTPSSWESGVEVKGSAGIEADGIGSLSVELLSKDFPLFGYPVPKE